MCSSVWIHGKFWYLAGRSQSVVIGGEQSSRLPVVSGVPQGSVLGTLLFIVYVNELTSIISPYSRVSMFADDIAAYCTISAAADYIMLQPDISAIDHWVQDNILTFNKGKCCTMFISRKSLRSNPPPTLLLGASALTRVDSFKYLGITLSSDLSWSLHVQNINTKVQKLVSLLYRRFHFCPTPTLVTSWLYRSANLNTITILVKKLRNTIVQ